MFRADIAWRYRYVFDLGHLLVSASISLPLAVYQTVTCNKEHNIYICHERSPKVTLRQFFTICSLVLRAVHHCVLGQYLLLLSSFLRPAQRNSPYSRIGRFAGRIKLLFAHVFHLSCDCDKFQHLQPVTLCVDERKLPDGIPSCSLLPDFQRSHH